MYTYKSTGTTKAQNFTLTLDLIDPEDGTVTHLRTFTNEDTHSCSAYIQGAGGNIDDVNMIFADDYSKLAATVYMEDGSRHVGWMNEDGSFTDVSAMVTESSDFGALTDHRDPVFWNGYIYWRDYTNDDEDPDILRAPIESLTPGSVETMLENEQWNGTDLYPMEDGTVTDEMRCYDSYDSSFTHGAPIGHIGDWLDEDTCVRASDGKIFVTRL